MICLLTSGSYSVRPIIYVRCLSVIRQPPTPETVKNPEYVLFLFASFPSDQWSRKFLSLHALVVGIDDYRSPEVPNLKGVVADADAFSNYLMNRLNVPRSQITDLRDAKATRENIISGIRDLGRKNDDHILNMVTQSSSSMDTAQVVVHQPDGKRRTTRFSLSSHMIVVSMSEEVKFARYQTEHWELCFISSQMSKVIIFCVVSLSPSASFFTSTASDSHF